MDTPDDYRCRDCLWFNPAYDQCRFYGAVSVDDPACESFQPAD